MMVHVVTSISIRKREFLDNKQRNLSAWLTQTKIGKANALPIKEYSYRFCAAIALVQLVFQLRSLLNSEGLYRLEIALA